MNWVQVYNETLLESISGILTCGGYSSKYIFIYDSILCMDFFEGWGLIDWLGWDLFVEVIQRKLSSLTLFTKKVWHCYILQATCCQ